MNAFEKLTDLSIAFICMFVIPFLFFQSAEMEAEQQKASDSANYFLECVQNKGAITAELCRQLTEGNYANAGNLVYEVEVGRTEYLPEEYGGRTYVRYSWSELLELLSQKNILTLHTGDSVSVKIYGSGLFNGSHRMLTDQEKEI